jgi:ferredoxin
MLTAGASESPLALAAESASGRARALALDAMARVATKPTSAVGYKSTGTVVIIGPEEAAIAAAEALHPRLECTVVTAPASARKAGRANARSEFVIAREKVLQISGHLGQFAVVVAAPAPLGGANLLQKLASPRTHFDLVLDLTDPPFVRHELRPFGYYAPGGDPNALRVALAEMPEMIGEFEKPRFFRYDPAICAHSKSGQTGCTRCLDACPAGAIVSLIEEVAVDPYLCQGAGLCATVCPTGAMTYVYPTLPDQLRRLAALLKAYRAEGGDHPFLLLHDAEAGRHRLAALTAELPDNVIPFELAELGSLGMEAWLAALAYGAEKVFWLSTSGTPPSVIGAVSEQSYYAGKILEGMGYSPSRLQMLGGDDAAILAALGSGQDDIQWPPAAFGGVDEKRTVLRLAIEHLYTHAPAPQEAVALPQGAPFGEVLVNRDTCTLCMACVSVCPASALSDGADLPQLNFVEANCVQCGLCEGACPEQAIERTPRYLYDGQERRRSRVLNEEAPFLCVSCGRPFATRQMMDRMTEKLRGHWMFDSDEALRRLRMCGDCRVRDMFAGGGHRPGEFV